MMTNACIRLLERACGPATWVLGVCAVWLVLSSVFFREELPKPRLVVQVDDGGIEAAAVERPMLEELAGIWKRDLRQTLIEVKTVAAPKPPPPPPPKPTRLPKLLATFVEDGKSWGVFVSKEKGASRVRGVASTIDGFAIVEISPGLAKLEKNGRAYEVKAPKRKRASARGGRRAGRSW